MRDSVSILSALISPEQVEVSVEEPVVVKEDF